LQAASTTIAQPDDAQFKRIGNLETLCASAFLTTSDTTGA